MKKNLHPNTLTTVESTSSYNSKTEVTVIVDLYVYNHTLLYNKSEVTEHKLIYSEDSLEITINKN